MRSQTAGRMGEVQVPVTDRRRGPGLGTAGGTGSSGWSADIAVDEHGQDLTDGSLWPDRPW